jgi:hypothetical protein
MRSTDPFLYSTVLVKGVLGLEVLIVLNDLHSLDEDPILFYT